jgi:hypothetical protein
MQKKKFRDIYNVVSYRSYDLRDSELDRVVWILTDRKVRIQLEVVLYPTSIQTAQPSRDSTHVSPEYKFTALYKFHEHTFMRPLRVTGAIDTQNSLLLD